MEDIDKEHNDHLEQNHINEHKQTYDAEQGIPNEYVGLKAMQGNRNGLLPGLDGKDRSSVPPFEQIKILKTLDQNMEDKRKAREVNSEWRDLANIMDRIFLLVYSVTTLIVTLAFLLQCVVQ